MGRDLAKRMFLVLAPIVLFHLLISSSSGASVNSTENNGVCISKGGRFTPFESEGKPPKTADLEFKDLNHGKTCCSASQMIFVSYGESTKNCLDLFELLECSICHPSGEALRICASFCDKVFEACKDTYFTSDASNQVIVLCGSNEGIICGKASKWKSNGTAFCNAMGFSVQTADEEPCYDGSKSSLEPMVESLIKTRKCPFLRLVQKLDQQITWLVSLLVPERSVFFSIGLAFYRLCYQLQMVAIYMRFMNLNR